MSASNLREAITPRFGRLGFTVIYLLVTIITLSGLITALAIYGDQGLDGLQITNAYLLGLLKTGSAIGAFLIVAGLVGFPTSPMSILAQRLRTSLNDKPLPSPKGIALISRHPFFVGLALISLCHVFLASTMAVATFFAGLLIFSLLGIPMQDYKLRRRWAETYIRYEQQSSVMPFAKFFKQPERPTKSEWVMWIACLMATIVIFGIFHFIWMYANGVGFLIMVLLYGTLGTCIGIFRTLRTKKVS